MSRRNSAIALTAICGLLAVLASAPGASARTTGPSPRPGSAAALLYVQQTRSGELERVRRGVYRLRLRGVSARVSTFTDRPRRRAGQQVTQRFVRAWKRNGFAADPPNAALVVDDAQRGRDVAMLTLSRPRYDARRGVLTYTARPLHGRSADTLSGFAERADRIRPRRFGAADLFIDDGGGTVYAAVQLQVSNAAPGQEISVRVSSAGGGPIGWSSGPTFASGSGIEITSVSGELPIAALDIEQSEIVVRTTQAGGGASLTFTIGLFLVAEAGTETYYMRSESDPGVLITAAVGNLPPETVNQVRAPFPWNWS